AGVQHPGEPELHHLEQRPAVDVAGQHEVVGRQIAMEVAFAMEVADHLQRLLPEGERQADGERPRSLEDVGQGPPLDELLDDEGAAACADREVVDVGDVRMAKLQGEAVIAQEAFGRLRRDLRRVDHLDVADLVEQPVADQVDRPRLARRDLVEDLVRAVELGIESGHLQANCNTPPRRDPAEGVPYERVRRRRRLRRAAAVRSSARSASAAGASVGIWGGRRTLKQQGSAAPGRAGSSVRPLDSLVPLPSASKKNVPWLQIVMPAVPALIMATTLIVTSPLTGMAPFQCAVLAPDVAT